jgi:hypothetical protein
MSLQQPISAWQFDDGSVVVLPELTTDLPDGMTGYYERDFYDCLHCSVATLLQMPYEEITGLKEEGEAATLLARFARDSGLELRAHPADEPPDHLWIGVSYPFPHKQDGHVRHAYVMSGSELFFNPSGWRYPDGSPFIGVGGTAFRTEYGFSLHRKEPT